MEKNQKFSENFRCLFEMPKVKLVDLVVTQPFSTLKRAPGHSSISHGLVQRGDGAVLCGAWKFNGIGTHWMTGILCFGPSSSAACESKWWFAEAHFLGSLGKHTGHMWTPCIAYMFPLPPPLSTMGKCQVGGALSSCFSTETFCHSYSLLGGQPDSANNRVSLRV